MVRLERVILKTVLLLFLSLVLLFYVYSKSFECVSVKGTADFPVGRVAHAGGIGFKEGQANTRFAIQRSYAHGFHLIELDLLQTKDGVWVCQYGWEGIPPSYPFFQKNNNATKWPFCDLSWLFEWREGKNVYFILDTKQGNIIDLAEKISVHLKNNEGEKKFWIPQAYNLTDYEEIRRLGFEYVIYTVYKLADKSVVIEEARKMSVDGTAFTIPAGVNNWQLGKDLGGMGFPIFYHTVNDERHLELLKDNGCASNVYTDVLLPD